MTDSGLTLTIASLIGLWLGLRVLFLWLGERKAKLQGFYGYPFLKEVRPNQRRGKVQR